MEKNRDVFKAIFNLLGGISGLLSLALVVYKGGALVNTVENHAVRITNIEQAGSMGLREHVKMDDERVTDLRTRTTRLEDMLIKFSEVSSEVKVVSTKVDAIKEQLGKMQPTR